MLKLVKVNLTFKIGNQINHIFNDFDLTVKPGEFLIIIGGNGAGKTTLFNLICGNLKPNEGSIFLDKVDVTSLSRVRQSNDIALVMQDPLKGTIEQMTIYENLCFAQKRGQKRGLKFFDSALSRDYFKQKLSLLKMGLENRLDELVGSLSGGQRQALSLIMAISANYKILLLDEITAALDPKTSEKVMEISNEIIKKEGITAIMITHNMHHAVHFGDRLVLLNSGEIIKDFCQQEKQQLDPMTVSLLFNELYT